MKKTYRLSILFIVLIIAWMAGGMLYRPSPFVKEEAATLKDILMKVEVTQLEARPVVHTIAVQGQVLPSRELMLKAETAGKVAEILKREGDRVKKGDVILRIALDDRLARLSQAKARVLDQQRKRYAFDNLQKKGLSTQTRLLETEADLKEEQAELEKIKMEIKQTTIIAPFSGILFEQKVEEGAYVEKGSILAELIDNDPLHMSVAIGQLNIKHVTLGEKVAVKFITGEERTGVVHFIAPRAEPTTRTFRTEIEIENPEGLRSGMSATALIPTTSQKGYKVSPATLSLSDQGFPGVKVVNEKHLVKFYPVKIIRSETSGVWVTGLPDKVTLITQGQGFVSDGEQVKIKMKKE